MRRADDAARLPLVVLAHVDQHRTTVGHEAVGFDRVLMLLGGYDDIADVLPFPFDTEVAEVGLVL
mgnify:CR=1 FL=1